MIAIQVKLQGSRNRDFVKEPAVKIECANSIATKIGSPVGNILQGSACIIKCNDTTTACLGFFFFIFYISMLNNYSFQKYFNRQFGKQLKRISSYPAYI